jgi:geranylgeranyl diphosphate synthase, type I
MNQFRAYIARYRNAIQSEISEAIHSFPQVHPQFAEEYQLFSLSTQGGKNIRGTLVQLGYFLTNPVEDKELLKVSAAFEILHASLLIHDDIIDRSDLRRGRPTIHRALGRGHYGISQAICLGDMGLFLATKLIAESKISNVLKAKVSALFSQMVMDTIAGEMLDIKISLSDYHKNITDIMLMQQLKTASYTIVGPLIIGAMLGRANKKQLQAIKKFGEHIGMAFQIQDDILGVFGDEKMVGKSARSDIEENKSTLLIMYAFTKATPRQRKTLDSSYGTGKITVKQHEMIKKIFEQTGALLYSQSKVEENIVEGKKYIPAMTKNQDAQVILMQFLDFILQRQK